MEAVRSATENPVAKSHFKQGQALIQRHKSPTRHFLFWRGKESEQPA